MNLVWSCEFQKKNPSWTVGEKRLLICKGNTTEKIKTLPQIYFPKIEEEKGTKEAKQEELKERKELEKKDLKYSLHILDFSSIDPSQAAFLVTSYKPGKFKSSFFIQTEKQKIFVQPPLEWNVQSVIKTSMGLKPYGPMGPFLFPWPLKYKIGGSLVVILLILFLSSKLYKFLLRSWWKKKLKKSKTLLSPYHQLNKDIRKMARKMAEKQPSSPSFSLKNPSPIEEKCKSYIEELEAIFRMYLTRKFLIPVNLWKIEILVKDLKSKGKKEPKDSKDGFLSLAEELLFIFKEFKKAKEDLSLKLNILDCNQLTKWTREWSEKLESLEKAEKEILSKKARIRKKG